MREGIDDVGLRAEEDTDHAEAEGDEGEDGNDPVPLKFSGPAVED